MLVDWIRLFDNDFTELTLVDRDGPVSPPSAAVQSPATMDQTVPAVPVPTPTATDSQTQAQPIMPVATSVTTPVMASTPVAAVTTPVAMPIVATPVVVAVPVTPPVSVPVSRRVSTLRIQSNAHQKAPSLVYHVLLTRFRSGTIPTLLHPSCLSNPLPLYQQLCSRNPRPQSSRLSLFHRPWLLYHNRRHNPRRTWCKSLLAYPSVYPLVYQPKSW
jgi:hypothetical protein